VKERKMWAPVSLMLVIMLSVVSCGQKGDLYLAEPESGEQVVLDKKSEKKKEIK